MTEEYQTLRTNVPPVLAVENGELVVKLIFGNQTFVAGVSDGRWFFSQVVAKLVDPALLAVHTERVLDAHVGRAMATGESWLRVTDKGTELVDDPRESFASPND